MSRYHTIISNDVVNGEGVCVSFFVQGCPHHCHGCFNEETWDFKGGQEYTDHTKWEIIEAIGANGIHRNFSILGGEPLARLNIGMVKEVVATVRNAYPDIKIFLWTGYTTDELNELSGESLEFSETFSFLLDNIDVLIDGRFVEEKKDLSLKLRGSHNQNVYRKNKDGIWEIEE